IVVDASTTLTLDTDSSTNSGLIDDSGILNLTKGTLTNQVSGGPLGFLTVESGGLLNLDTASISLGTVTVLGTGKLESKNGASTIAGATLINHDAGSKIVVDASTTLTLDTDSSTNSGLIDDSGILNLTKGTLTNQVSGGPLGFLTVESGGLLNLATPSISLGTVTV